MSAFIDQQRAAGFAVELTCRSIGTSPSAYYQRATGQRSTRAVEDERLLVAIRRVYRANYEAYGSLRVWKALKREGIMVGRGRVERLMAADGLVGAKRRGRAWKTTVADPAGCERPDLVNRDFSATRPDALCIADFTYLKSWEGVGFFSFVLDVYSRRCVGWQLSGNMRTDLVLDALKMALGTRRHGADLQLIHHSDRGSQPELNRSSQHRVIGQRTVAGETRAPESRGAAALLSSRRLARRAGRSGDSHARERRGRGVVGRRRGGVRLLRRGARRGPRPGSAIRVSCGAGR